MTTESKTDVTGAPPVRSSDLLASPYYDEGGITIFCGDNRRILPLLDDYDLLLTDPPYGLGARLKSGDKGEWSKGFNVAPEWDAQTAPEWMLQLAISKCRWAIVWGGNYYALPPRRGWLVWQKPDRPPSMADAEMAWVSKDMNTRILPWTIAATNAERVGHPTQKPVRVMAWTLEQLGVPKGATVLDPYMGSGTTGIACIRLGMNFIGIERDAAHYKTACDRIAHELDGALL